RRVGRRPPTPARGTEAPARAQGVAPTRRLPGWTPPREGTPPSRIPALGTRAPTAPGARMARGRWTPRRGRTAPPARTQAAAATPAAARPEVARAGRR